MALSAREAAELLGATLIEIDEHGGAEALELGAWEHECLPGTIVALIDHVLEGPRVDRERPLP